jgi:hypothetical protein
LAVLVLGTVVSGVMAVVGVVEIPRVWMVLAGCGVTAVAALAVRALETCTLKKKVNALWCALTVASSIPLVAFAYHQWFDASSRAQERFPLLANGADPAVMRPANYPGGPLGGYLHGGIIGGSTVWVSCYVVVPEADRWYWVSGDRGWVPASAVRPIPGLHTPQIPHC